MGRLLVRRPILFNLINDNTPMVKTALLSCLLIALAFLGACGKPRELTFEEQQAYMAKQQCAQAASDMNPEWPSSSNPYWDDYFVMCMHQFGISNAALRRMWY